MRQKLNKWLQPNNVLMWVGAVVLLYLSLCDLANYTTIHILPDEFGYLASTAFFTGKDWSGVASQLAYYSYGYALLLAPVIRFFSDYKAIYSSIIIINSIFLLASYGMSIYFLKETFPKLNRTVSILLAFLSSCYVSNLVYVRMAWPEVALNACYWLLILLVFAFVKKPGNGKAVGMAALGMFMYIIHQRNLGVVVALVLVVLLLFFLRFIRFHHAMIFSGSLGFFYIVQKAMKKWVSSKVWLQEQSDYSFLWKNLLVLLLAITFLVGVRFLFETLKRKGIRLHISQKTRKILIYGFFGCLAIGFVVFFIYKINGFEGDVSQIDLNDYNGVFKNLQHTLLAKGGVTLLFQKIFGRFYYIGIATGWLAIWGMVQACMEAASLGKVRFKKGQSIRQLRTKHSGSFVCAFLVLSLCFTIGISALFMINGTRQDTILYGRYSEGVIAPLVLLGVVTLFYTSKKVLPGVLTILFAGVTLLFTYSAFAENVNNQFNINSNLAVIKYFKDGVNGLDQIIPLGFTTFGLLLLGVALISLPIWKQKVLKKCRKWIMVLYFCVVAYCLWVPNIFEMIDSITDTQDNVEAMIEPYLEKLEPLGEMEELYFVFENDLSNIRLAELLQFHFPDTKLHFVDMWAEDTFTILKENKEYPMMIQPGLTDRFFMYDLFYLADDADLDYSSDKMDWQIFVPIDSFYADHLRKQGIGFINTGDGLQFTKENTFSQNLDSEYKYSWVSNGEMGYLACGQYIPLPPGEYVFSADLSTVNTLGTDLILDVAVVGDVLAEERIDMQNYAEPNMSIHCEIPFSLEEHTAGLEFRVFTSQGVQVRIDRLVVKGRR